MQLRQRVIASSLDVDAAAAELAAIAPDLLLVFASPRLPLADLRRRLAAALPKSLLVGCSTAGEISSQGIGERSAVLTALSFAAGEPVCATTRYAGQADSEDAGRRLGRQLAGRPASLVWVFSQGVDINGSALIAGLSAELPAGTCIVGGMAGDDGAFRSTQVLGGDEVGSDLLVALAFPPSLTVGYGSFGGWTPFGPARKVTRSAGNQLFELDGEPALDIYKRYLGEYAQGLPASGLLFPFEMLGQDHQSTGLIRTILAVDEAAGSLTLAGDIEPGGYLRLMHASNDSLIDGAESAAKAAAEMMRGRGDGLCLLVSCIGRKLVMGKRTDEEIEAVGAVFGTGATLAGFYSYGEFSPFFKTTDCKLHNQTMTVTYLSEAG